MTYNSHPQFFWIPIQVVTNSCIHTYENLLQQTYHMHTVMNIIDRYKPILYMVDYIYMIELNTCTVFQAISFLRA